MTWHNTEDTGQLCDGRYVYLTAQSCDAKRPSVSLRWCCGTHFKSEGGGTNMICEEHHSARRDTASSHRLLLLSATCHLLISQNPLCIMWVKRHSKRAHICKARASLLSCIRKTVARQRRHPWVTESEDERHSGERIYEYYTIHPHRTLVKTLVQRKFVKLIFLMLISWECKIGCTTSSPNLLS